MPVSFMLLMQITRYSIYCILQARGYLMSLPFKPTVAWSKLYSSADSKGQYLLLFRWLCSLYFPHWHREIG